MRIVPWTCTLALCLLPPASAQDLEQFRATIETHIAAITIPDDLDRTPPSPGLVQASQAVFDTAARIYALPNLDEQDRHWTLQREAVALIILAYAEPAKYYPKLMLISDELEQRRLEHSGLARIVKETEKHVLELGGILATETGVTARTIDSGPLAKRMVYYADQYPGRDSMLILEHFLRRIYSMKNAGYRDRRLAVVAPVFRDYFQRVNHTARAAALEPDIARATLPGMLMPIRGVDINGNDFDPLSVQDKVVLLQFWGTWCVHCKEQIPELMALYDKYRDAGFEIIGVNTGAQGDDENRVKRFLDTPLPGGKKIPWTILHEGLGERKNRGWSMTKFYGIDELPVLILVGRNGRVLDLHPLLGTLDTRLAEVTSLIFAVESELSEEERNARDEVRKKQREEEERRIQEELSL